jgi:hypothetical protein
MRAYSGQCIRPNSHPRPSAIAAAVVFVEAWTMVVFP